MSSTKYAPTSTSELMELLRDDLKVKVAGELDPTCFFCDLLMTLSSGIDGQNYLCCQLCFQGTDVIFVHSGWCTARQVYGASSHSYSC